MHVSPNLAAINKIFGDVHAPNGLPVHENFAKWFGNSKVVGSDGEPLVVYHGTGNNFSNFCDFGTGIHFGTKEQAQSRLGTKAGLPLVMPVYLSIKKPLRTLDAFNDPGGKPVFLAMNLRNQGFEIPKGAAFKDITCILEEARYDGIVYENRNEGPGDSYIVFSPRQVKSATGNSGDFDPYSSLLTDVEEGGFALARQEEPLTRERMRT